jgi:hypothetical protein
MYSALFVSLVRIPVGESDISLLRKVEISSETHPAPYSVGGGRKCVKQTRREVKNSLLSSAEVKDE